MMELLDDVFIRCETCGKVSQIPKEEIEFETYAYDHGDSGMGDEITFIHNSRFACFYCGSEISVQIFGSEYPLGAFDYEECKIEGGAFYQTPHMGVIYPLADFDSDDTYLQRAKHIEQKIMEIARDRDLIYDISPREFEEIVERLFQDHGFKTILTQQAKDGGKDIIATKYEMGKPVVFYVECKRYQRQNSVGISVVRSLYGVQSADQINKAILVTTGRVTRGAREFVEKRNTMMSVVGADEIHRLILQSAKEYSGS